VTSPHAYREAAYTPVPPSRRWWPLAAREATQLFRSRWGMLLYGLCLIPFLVRTVILMIVYGVLSFGLDALRNRLQSQPIARGGGPGPELDPRSLQFYAAQAIQPPAFVFVLLLTSMVVARAIARDRATNALELYWTRGISPAQYVLAKWAGGTLLVGSITVVAPFVLWLIAIFLAPDWSLLQNTAGGMAVLLGGLALATGILTAIGTLVSGAATTANGAIVAWTTIMVGGGAIAELLAAVLRVPELRSWVAPWTAFGVVVRDIAGLPQRNASVVGAWCCLGALLAWSAWRARKRLRMEDALA
jgi:ABC-type transport system involved in multi-copper enzyme maturation permease subunit